MSNFYIHFQDINFRASDAITVSDVQVFTDYRSLQKLANILSIKFHHEDMIDHGDDEWVDSVAATIRSLGAEDESEDWEPYQFDSLRDDPEDMVSINGNRASVVSNFREDLIVQLSPPGDVDVAIDIQTAFRDNDKEAMDFLIKMLLDL